MCCEAYSGESIQEAALAADCEEHVLGCLRCPAARGVGPSLSLCRRCSGHLQNTNLPTTLMRCCVILLGCVCEGKVSLLSFEHFCHTKIRPHVPVGLGVEQEKKVREEG